MLWQARRGLISGRAALDAASAPTGPSYAYRGAFNSTTQNPSTSITVGTAAARVIVGVTSQGANTISSVVVDGVTLTQRCFDNTADAVGIYDGSILAGSASRTVTVNWGTASSLDRDFFVWTATGLATGYAGTSFAGWTGFPAGFSVTAGDFLFSVTRASTARTWAASTEIPAINSSGPQSYAADWTIAGSTASFHNYPDNSGLNAGPAYAVYR